jgi:hypothetical protein
MLKKQVNDSLFCYFLLENLLLKDLRSVWGFYIVFVIKKDLKVLIDVIGC